MIVIQAFCTQNNIPSCLVKPIKFQISSYLQLEYIMGYYVHIHLWAKVKKVVPPGAEPVHRSEAVVLERERLPQVRAAKSPPLAVQA